MENINGATFEFAAEAIDVTGDAIRPDRPA
jgi:hypothetical protein